MTQTDKQHLLSNHYMLIHKRRKRRKPSSCCSPSWSKSKIFKQWSKILTPTLCITNNPIIGYPSSVTKINFSFAFFQRVFARFATFMYKLSSEGPYSNLILEVFKLNSRGLDFGWLGKKPRNLNLQYDLPYQWYCIHFYTY